MRSRALYGICVPTLFAAAAVIAGAATDAPIAYEHQTWQTESGLPQNSVHSIAQTKDGYLWLATEDGLARFDGVKFVVFDSENTPQLRNNNIRCLLEARDGSLWIATADGLTRLQHGQFSLFTTNQGLPSNNVLSLSQDGAGVLTATTSDGAAEFQSGAFRRKLERATGALQVLPSELANADVQALLTDRLGRLWIGTRDGLFVRKEGRTEKVVLRPLLGSNQVTALSEDAAGTIWVGTEAGAARIVADKLSPIASPDSVSQGLILSFFEDREGDMWIGTDSEGVTVLRDQRFRKFGREQGMPEELVRCVYEDARGMLWAGTDGHGLLRFNGQSFSSLTASDGLSSDVILSIASDAHDNLLVGTPDGLNILHQGYVQLLTSADGLPDDFIRSIYRDADGSVWIGTRRGLAHYLNGRFTNYTTADGLPSDFVGAILRGKNGVLWVGTLKGLICIRGGNVERPQPLKGFGEAITALYEDDDGVLWIGGDSGGLARLQRQQALQFPAALGLPNSVSGIAEDSKSQLWITSPHGLFRVSKAELNAYAADKKAVVSVVSYGTGDGLPVNEFSTGGHPTILKDRRNAIWLASAKGLVAIDQQHTAPDGVAPLVALEHVTAGDRVIDPAEVRAFGPGLERISFEYTGLSFAAPQQIRFKYRLEGFDKSWIDAGTRRTAYYTNLPPGAYRFVVLARNKDGVWSRRGAWLSFQLRPHVYQTAWFRSLAVLMLAGLAYMLYRRRVNQVRMQFNAVMAERNRIARDIHDTLAQGFVGVSVQVELARRLMSTSLDAANKVLEQTQTLVQESLAEARRSIWNLRSESGLHEDLPSKLSKAVRRSVDNRGLDVSLEVSGVYRPLPATVETEVLRIGQEAVANVVRHANATRLEVRLIFDSTKAKMDISDNGQGFVPDEQAKAAGGHFGLRGMRERAEAIRGKLSVTTAIGKGTQVSLELPLK